MLKPVIQFTKWNEPATKGDVVRALVFSRACTIDIYVALLALSQNDMDKLKAQIEELRQHDDKLQEIIDDIGGAVRE